MTVDYEICSEPFHRLSVRASCLYRRGEEPKESNFLMDRIRGKKEEDLASHFTEDEEYELINKQIQQSQGFDVDFSMFRILFNFYPAFLDECNIMEEQIRKAQDFVDDSAIYPPVFDLHPTFFYDIDPTKEPEQDRVYFGRLAKEAIVGYNQREGTGFEFVDVEKANIYMGGSGFTYFITFLVRDDIHNREKTFQAKVRNVYCREFEHCFCRLKPGQDVTCDEDSKNVAKKPRVQ